MVKYKIVFSDYDDTITLFDGTVTQATKDAISAYRKAGGEFVITTGRSAKSTRGLLSEVFGEDGKGLPYICYQGGMTVVDDEIIRHVTANKGALLRLAELLASRGEILQTYSGEKMFCKEMTPESENYSRITKCPFDVVGDMPTFMKSFEGEFEKMLIIGDADRLPSLRDELASRPEFKCFSFMFSRPTYLEAVPVDSGKDKAIEFFAKYRGVPISQTAAFGDGNNDVELLKSAGFGVAVGNARPETKAAADYVCPPNTEDGLAQTLLGFIE